MSDAIVAAIDRQTAAILRLADIIAVATGQQTKEVEEKTKAADPVALVEAQDQLLAERIAWVRAGKSMDALGAPGAGQPISPALATLLSREAPKGQIAASDPAVKLSSVAPSTTGFPRKPGEPKPEGLAILGAVPAAPAAPAEVEE